jgi:transposase
MDDPADIGSPISVNRNGGFYEHGKNYGFSRKWEVAAVYFRLWEDNWPIKPKIRFLSRHAGVSQGYANKIVQELTTTGGLKNPCATKMGKNVARGVGLDLSLEEEVFLLALRIECPSRPNTDYSGKLKDFYDRDISPTTISVWFRERYDYAGTFKVPNLVPIDKWMMRNATRVMAYRAIMDMFPDHSKWNFLDEKHIVNGDTLSKKVRADPLTGYVDAIPVSGDFRDAHNIFAIVSGNPNKRTSIAYHITKANGNATQFVAFIKMLIITDFFEHNEILVMDNARIHTAGEAECVEFYLWNTVIQGHPLHVKIVYLPTRCPELNPIEFMFHLLSSRIRSFRYRIVGAIDRQVVALIGKIFDEIEYQTIIKTYLHCGYMHSRPMG